MNFKQQEVTKKTFSLVVKHKSNFIQRALSFFKMVNKNIGSIFIEIMKKCRHKRSVTFSS